MTQLPTAELARDHREWEHAGRTGQALLEGDRLELLGLLPDAGLGREPLHRARAIEADEWTWSPQDGGTGLWIDIGEDALALAEVAKRAGVKLAPGPGFSPHEAHRAKLRLPVWHPRHVVAEALGRLREG